MKTDLTEREIEIINSVIGTAKKDIDSFITTASPYGNIREKFINQIQELESIEKKLKGAK